MISGGQNLVQVLHAHGVDTVFCVAGESYLPVLDALLDFPDIKIVTCRHESGASFMAEAYANLTGKVGIVFVTRGPGACNGSIGIHTARQSSTPVIMFSGLISSEDKGKEAFQEFDLPGMFATHSKWAADIAKADDITAMVTKAFYIAREGRPGPVVLGLPEDILSASVKNSASEPQAIKPLHASSSQLKKLRKILTGAKNPVVIVGGGGWNDAACTVLKRFATDHALPVVASFRRQDIFDHNHESYFGDLGFGPNPDLVARVKSADVVLVLGARISDVLTQGYTLFQKDQRIIHVYPSKSVFGKAYKPELAIEAHPWLVIEALKDLKTQWRGWCARGRGAFEVWTQIPDAKASNWNGADMTQVFGQLRNLLPKDAVITTDAGNFSGWANRYLRFARPMRQLAPLSGAMGYAVPAAVSASIAAPERTVVSVCGDGGFMMTGQEIATAVHMGAKPIIIVCNNNMYGTIRMHQERDFPGRISGTALTNPDFVKLAESYGAFAARVTHADEFAKVWQAAVAANRPSLIEICMDPRQIATTSKS